MEPAAGRDLDEWHAVVATDDNRRAFTEGPRRGEDWVPLTVPGHWRSSDAFAATDGPLLYRAEFDHAAPAEGRRAWLTFDGIFYQGDVWLDGTYLGDTEGYFLPHTMEITDLLRDRREHVLGVEVTCSPQRDRKAKRNLTGVFQHWDCLDPEWNPGGIWRPVRLRETGPVRIRDLRVLCREATSERAVVVLRANLETLDARTVVVRSAVGDVQHQLTQTLATGENHVEWTITVPSPALWWPWALGSQPLYEVVVEVWCDDQLSHRRARRTGLRRVEFHDWVCSINGERLFLKGTNQGPTRMAIAEATADELARDVRLAKETGLDLLRVHAHITRRELYDAADELGMLLWQDLPLQWGYARGVRKEAVREARAAVAVLGHHPSIAIWCGHNEPMAIDIEPGGQLGVGTAGAALAAQMLPTWNRTILDRSIKRALRAADGTRPVIAHSGVLPHLPQLDGTDSHLYFGWYHGDERDLPRLAARLPRMVRFVTEFGAQAVPENADFCHPERWPDLDWDQLGRRHSLQKPVFDRRVPPAEFASFADWRAATQRYQATVIKHHIETLRRLKYRPAGGFAQFCFADGYPAVTWSVLDHERAPKAGHAALRDACAPVIVVADRLPTHVHPGDPVALHVHVVSDLRTPLTECVVEARVASNGGVRSWTFGGDVDADSCVRVGTLSFDVPDTTGDVSVELELRAGPIRAFNRYSSPIQA